MDELRSSVFSVRTFGKKCQRLHLSEGRGFTRCGLRYERLASPRVTDPNFDFDKVCARCREGLTPGDFSLIAEQQPQDHMPIVYDHRPRLHDGSGVVNDQNWKGTEPGTSKTSGASKRRERKRRELAGQ